MDNPKRILVVADDEGFRYSSVVALRQEGYDARGIGDLRKAIDAIRGASDEKKPFQLLIADLETPATRGVELIPVLTERGIALHVLNISSTCAKGILCTMDCACGEHHLHKPFKPRDLVEKVRRILT
jgi:DNA-binding NtrC family response regulator